MIISYGYNYQYYPYFSLFIKKKKDKNQELITKSKRHCFHSSKEVQYIPPQMAYIPAATSILFTPGYKKKIKLVIFTLFKLYFT